MNIAISLAQHEIQMAHRWFDFVIELSGTDGHSLYLIPAAGTSITDILPKAQKAFGGRVTIVKDEEGESSDWQNTEQLRSAAGPNSSFRQMAWHFYMNKLGPYFWCELDCIPLRKEWLDRLEADYKACGKPFMGAHVIIESVPEHMSGNAIYPTNVPEEAPTLVQRANWTPKGQSCSFELAFDIAGAKEVLEKAHFTNLIQHKFRYKGFKSREEFDAIIDPNAVVFHSDKKGTIYPYLRENLSGVSVQAESTAHKNDTKNDEARESTEESMSVQAMPTVHDSRGPAQTFEERWPTVNEIAEKQRIGTTTGSPTVVSQTFAPELETIIAQQSLIKNGLPPLSPPWENREDSEADVRMLCNALALFCKAPVYKSRVRNALREAKIIK